MKTFFTLGTVQLGMPYGLKRGEPLISLQQTLEILRRAIEGGVTHFDTARAYGESEARLGEARKAGILSSQCRVLTKLAPDVTAKTPEDTVKKVRASVEASLLALHQPSLDALLLHRWQHRFVHEGALWKELLRLKAQGLIQALGASVSTPEEACQAASDPEITHLQIPCNILDWRWESSGFAGLKAQRPDLQVFARSMYLQGILISDPSTWPVLAGLQPEVWVGKLEAVAARLGRTRKELCSAYLRSLPWIDSVVVGVENVSQLEENLKLGAAAPLTGSQRQDAERALGKCPSDLLDPSRWPAGGSAPRKLRILFLARQFHPCIGGTETYLLECARFLVRQGHAVTVLTLNRNIWNGEVLPEEAMVEGIQVIRIPYLNLKLRPVAWCSPFKLAKLFQQADLIHNHDIRFLFEFSLLAKYVFRRPLVIGSYGYILHQKSLKWLKQFVFKYYYRPLFRFIDALHAISIQDREKVEAVLPPDKITLILGGVDTAKFRKLEPAPVQGRLLYFGRLDAHKGLDLLLSSLQQVELPFELRIVFGSFRKDYRQALEQQAQALGLASKIRWVGGVSEEDLAREIQSAQMVLFPSRYEGYGLTTIEAMAAGALVVANDIDAFRNIIEDGKTGLLLDFNDPVTSGQRLKNLLQSDPSTQRPWGEAAAAYALNHDWSLRGQTLLALYEKLIPPRATKTAHFQSSNALPVA